MRQLWLLAALLASAGFDCGGAEKRDSKDFDAAHALSSVGFSAIFAQSKGSPLPSCENYNSALSALIYLLFCDLQAEFLTSMCCFDG